MKLLVASIALFLLPTAAFGLTILNQDIGCDPVKPPISGGCGLAQFFKLLQVIINFISIDLAAPIAAGVIIYGAIVIMTAGGSQERVTTGKKMITTAAIGVALVLAAWLIINTVYFVLTAVTS